MKFASKTLRLMAEYRERGYEIIVGNDWKKASRPKWAGHHVVKLAQTNGSAGWPERTVHAVRPRTTNQ